MGIDQLSLDFQPQRMILTVGELNLAIRTLLDSHFQDIWVAGEISGVKLSSSGHYYFTLKDQQSQLRCVCFRNAARYLRFKPQDGIAVLARGRIDVYEPRGEYQLLVEALEPQGFGALQLAFEQLKKKLSEEGLFDAARTRPLPRLPQRIGIVTSPTGAVIRDMLQILQRRFPGLHIRLELTIPSPCVEAGAPLPKRREFLRGQRCDLHLEILNLAHMVPFTSEKVVIVSLPNGLPGVNAKVRADQVKSAAHPEADPEQIPSWVQDYALYLLDVNGCIAAWYSGAARIYGYDGDEAHGQHVSILYPGEEDSSAEPRQELPGLWAVDGLKESVVTLRLENT